MPARLDRLVDEIAHLRPSGLWIHTTRWDTIAGINQSIPENQLALSIAFP
jgi:hypothetical protein